MSAAIEFRMTVKLMTGELVQLNAISWDDLRIQLHDWNHTLPLFHMRFIDPETYEGVDMNTPLDRDRELNLVITEPEKRFRCPSCRTSWNVRECLEWSEDPADRCRTCKRRHTCPHCG